jgi:hypothetical protein
MTRGLWGAAAALFSAAGLCSGARGQTTLYVDDDAPAGGNGSSWPTAFNDLNDATILAASLPPPVTIRIAGGVYRPRIPPGQIEPQFRLVDGESIIGGYRGLAPGGNPEERNTALFPTTLNAQLWPSVNQWSPNMFVAAAPGAALALDGLIVRDASSWYTCSCGIGAAGLHAPGCTVTITNCTFVNNDSAGDIASIQAGTLSMTDCSVLNSGPDSEEHPCVVYADWLEMTRCRVAGNYGGVACASGGFLNCLFEDNSGGLGQGGAGGVRAAGDVRLIGCTFRRNGSRNSTGGTVIAGGVATAVNCVFAANQGYRGAAMYGVIAAYNCSFLDNVTYSDGGAVYTWPGSVLVNCTLARNTGRYWGGGLWSNGGTAVSNCIFWGNTGGPTAEQAQIHGAPDIRYSLVQAWSGTLGGVGNSGLDPRFLDLVGGDLRLAPGSPAIDSAEAAALPPDTYDLDGDGNTTEPLSLDLSMRPRLVDDPATPDTGPGTPPFLDRGAFEYQTPSCYANCDGSTSIPLLTVDDFICFLTRFAAADPYANCDGSTTEPTLNVADLVCFQSRFAAGCP